ncbi:formamidopyrimidine-DNA glycosylase [Methanobrevibacter cuticularis]|uniref:Formamidopyrimidine-DNA glycosylase n=1 Tax=Methanobrevibacter cuticularis TaxID=47311 RepID=A0A166DGP9_9EURY|nr:zinc finger domain-containing protein [Methanobrevibacter cuticularis]KZX15581.1 formamidopyrimidine-DNA glycosylase [Methanobrevibacter cuticularis]
MMEFPESHSLSKELNKTIKGKKIVQVIAENSPHKFAFYYGDPKQYNDLLKGKTITESNAYGGQLEIIAEDTKIVLSDGAIIRYLSKDNEIPEKNQLIIKFEDSSAIYCTIQMYAHIHVTLTKDYENEYYEIAKAKPSPLSDDFSTKYFEGLILDLRSTTTLKSFLATKQRIPGLGNGTLQDILFNAKLHPKSNIKNLSLDDKERLFKSIKETLKRMTEASGRNTEKTLFNTFGKYKTILSAKTFKDPCPVCGNKIIKEAYMGGTVYYCPKCQPINK